LPENLIMRTYTVGEFKTHFSEILEWVKTGEKVAITYGKGKKVVAYLAPPEALPQAKRQLGLLAGKAEVRFKDDFSISEEEFLQG
jgi:antitoxin (DNA-binding transcriptional repressor) of toxin-antitoxin stability system